MTPRRLAAAVILAVWVGMMGWQVRREYLQPELARLSEAALALAPGVEFYTLRMGDRTVGLATSLLDTVPGGFRLEDVLSLELPALGQTGTAVARTQVGLTSSLSMADFFFSLDSDVGRFAATGSVEGDTLLQVEVDAGGRLQRVTHRLARPPVFAAALPIRLAAGEGLEVGSRVRFPVFDPSTISTRNVEVRVTAHDTLVVPDSAALDQETGRWMPAHYDSVPAWQIAEAFGGIQVESWVDEDGRIVRATSPLGFSMERTEYELARQAQEDARGLPGSPVDEDVVLSTAIQSDVNLEAVEGYRELRFRLSGVDLAGFELEGGRQSLRGDTLTVRQEVWAALDPGFELPYPRMDLRDYLSPEPLIQSDDERIIDAAERVTHRWPFQRQDPLRVAQHLTVAVNQRLEKSITISVPSAVQVLESGTGDCNEHTVLYVAMARALGLPARTAVGLVYLNGAFFYHAWPEVWLGQWVAVDPTFGQYPADAAHLRFVVGGLAQQIEILRLIGRLEIEVIPPHGQVQEEG